MPDAIGRYQVTGQLAAYQESRVYEAVDPLLERRLVIKVFSLDGVDGAEAIRAMFFDEVRRVGLLMHPGLVTLFDAGECPTGLFIASERIEGTSLAEWLTAYPTCSPTERVSIVTQVAETLEYVHAQGQAHLGLSVANLFVTPDGAVRVTGFGIVPVLKALQKAAGDPGATAGDARDDVFALGQIARTLLSTGESHPAVSVVLDRATASDRQERFPTAGPFGEALLDALGSAERPVRYAWEATRHTPNLGNDSTSAAFAGSSPDDETLLSDYAKKRLGASAVTTRSRD